VVEVENKKIQLICVICGDKFERYKSSLKKSEGGQLGICCSRRCQVEWQKTMRDYSGYVRFGEDNPNWRGGTSKYIPHPRQFPLKVKCICKTCKKEFEIWPCSFKKGEGKYCSKTCYGISLQEDGNRAWIDGRSKKRNPYKVKWKDGRKQKEHRIIMEESLGRKLSKDEIVHHIDGDKRNNKKSNLRILTRSEHAKLYWKQYRSKTKES